MAAIICLLCASPATHRVAYKGNLQAGIEPRCAVLCKSHGEKQRAEPDFSWIEELKPTVALKDAAAATVTYYQAQWEIWTPETDGGCGAYVEYRHCDHKHRTMRAADACGRDMAHAERRALRV